MAAETVREASSLCLQREPADSADPRDVGFDLASCPLRCGGEACVASRMRSRGASAAATFTASHQARSFGAEVFRSTFRVTISSLRDDPLAFAAGAKLVTRLQTARRRKTDHYRGRSGPVLPRARLRDHANAA